jgi:hypothetical protein
MPKQDELYSSDWDEIASRVKEAANWRCVVCSRQCYHPGERALDVRRVLTVAHLDHLPPNCSEDNLNAMCSGCHLRYDAGRKGLQRSKKRFWEEVSHAVKV